LDGHGGEDWLMDINRLIALNCYTRRQIYSLTGQRVEKSIIVVGNAIERNQIEKSILLEEPVVLLAPSGSGKLTIILDICDRHNLNFTICYDGNIPPEALYSDFLFIIRNPKKGKMLTDCIKRGIPLVLLYDSREEIPTGITPILIKSPTQQQMNAYKELKGYDMITACSTITPEEREKTLVEKFIRYDLPEEDLPESTHLWIARNFYSSVPILKLCHLANQVKNKTIYHRMMSLIKVKRPMDLKYPVRPKIK
jgi:hypothetical protein